MSDMMARTDMRLQQRQSVRRFLEGEKVNEVNQWWSGIFQPLKQRWAPKFGLLSEHIGEVLEGFLTEKKTPEIDSQMQLKEGYPSKMNEGCGASHEKVMMTSFNGDEIFETWGEIWKVGVFAQWESSDQEHHSVEFMSEKINAHFEELYEHCAYHLWNQVLRTKTESWSKSLRRYGIYRSDLEWQAERRYETIRKRWEVDHQNRRSFEAYISFRIESLFRDLWGEYRARGESGRLDEPVDADDEQQMTLGEQIPSEDTPPWKRIEQLQDLRQIQKTLFAELNPDDLLLLRLIYCGKYTNRVTRNGKLIPNYEAIAGFLQISQPRHITVNELRVRHSRLIQKVILNALGIVRLQKREDGIRRVYDIVRLHIEAGKSFADIAGEDFPEMTEQHVKQKYHQFLDGFKQSLTNMINELEELDATIGENYDEEKIVF